MDLVDPDMVLSFGLGQLLQLGLHLLQARQQVLRGGGLPAALRRKRKPIYVRSSFLGKIGTSCSGMSGLQRNVAVSRPLSNTASALSGSTSTGRRPSG